MCSGSEAGSYLRLIDFVYHSNPGLRDIKRERKREREREREDLLASAAQLENRLHVLPRNRARRFPIRSLLA